MAGEQDHYNLDGYSGTDIVNLINTFNTYKDRLTVARDLTDNENAVDNNIVNLDNVVIPGLYEFKNAYTIVKGPNDDPAWGPVGLIVDWFAIGESKGKVIRQVIFKTWPLTDNVYIRYRNKGGNWTAWDRFLTGNNIDATLSEAGQAADANAVKKEIAYRDVINSKYQPSPIKLTERAGIINYVNAGDVVDISNTTTSYAGTVVAASEGDIILREGACDGSSVRGLAFLDSEYKLLWLEGSGTYNMDTPIVAPANTAWVVLNNNNGGNYNFYVGKDIIRANNSDVEQLFAYHGSWSENSLSWTNQRVSGISGNIVDSNYSLLSSFFSSTGLIRCKSGYKCVLYAWKDGTYIGMWDGGQFIKQGDIVYHKGLDVTNQRGLSFRLALVQDALCRITLSDAKNLLIGTVIPDVSNAGDMAYSWWVTNRVLADNGALYFTYIGKNAVAGVGCRYPDGTIYRKDLFTSSSCDDHNAPAVCLVEIDGEQYVCVVGSTGHNASRKIHFYLAKEPNTIRCSFIDRTQSIIAPPSGKFYANSYAQVFVDDSNNIYDIFRVKQAASGDGTVEGIVWVCAKSSDLGQTWSIYRILRISATLDYMWLASVEGSNTLKRIILQRNTSATPVLPIRAGFVDLATNTVYDNDMNDIGKPMTQVASGASIYDTSITCAEYDDFTEIISAVNGYKIRILDVLETESSKLTFVYGRTAVQNNNNDFILYRYMDGESLEIDHLGMPFCNTSLYLTGACFCGSADAIVYSKNVSNDKDGAHELRVAELSDTTLDSIRTIKRSKQLIARPARYDGAIMYLAGRYNETPEAVYTSWALSLGFIDTL